MATFDSAGCGQHPEAAATTTCTRCGTFMCEGCTYFGVELKCVKCRIQRLPSEYPELLANAVKRSEMIRCRRCGYLGRRGDQIKPLHWARGSRFLSGCSWARFPDCSCLVGQ